MGAKRYTLGAMFHSLITLKSSIEFWTLDEEELDVKILDILLTGYNLIFNFI